jgi:hypothetical protein
VAAGATLRSATVAVGGKSYTTPHLLPATAIERIETGLGRRGKLHQDVVGVPPSPATRRRRADRGGSATSSRRLEWNRHCERVGKMGARVYS